ncbi:alpha/beta hydrolase [Nocardia blacklockiae]|uniref:alpha/beta hydrolase n=1 Tax=Nocardia blacklockiae TaxID=480036 RepID=UPI002B4B0BCC|nr:alpha/beta hydrolase [Nocardia blacklockiae]
MLQGERDAGTGGAAAEERPRARTRWWSPVRGTLLGVAALLGLYTVLAQLFALVPVRWTGPLLRVGFAQYFVLGLDWFRDWLGSWNPVLAAAAVIAALLGVRLRATWPARSVTGVAAVGLVMCVVTGVGLVLSAHTATGRWVLFAPAPLVAAGKSPNETVTYATLDGEPVRADLYLPAAGPAPAPLVVSIHGGGFVGGSRGPNPYHHWLAEHGYAVLDVDYRLSDAGHPRWNTEDADVGCALTWAAAHARKYHWDLERVATFGGSAGGNLAINVAYKVNAGRLRPSCGTAAELPKISAVVAVYPAVDLTASAADTAEGEALARQYLGGPAAQFPDRYAATDSAPQITPAAPPTLLFHGRGDHLVFASHTADFAEELTAAGITNRYVELPYLDHGFDTEVLNTGAQVGRAITLDWLDRHTRH